jgi:hypothetical protein
MGPILSQLNPSKSSHPISLRSTINWWDFVLSAEKADVYFKDGPKPLYRCSITVFNGVFDALRVLITNVIKSILNQLMDEKSEYGPTKGRRRHNTFSKKLHGIP